MLISDNTNQLPMFCFVFPMSYDLFRVSLVVNIWLSFRENVAKSGTFSLVSYMTAGVNDRDRLMEKEELVIVVKYSLPSHVEESQTPIKTRTV